MHFSVAGATSTIAKVEFFNGATLLGTATTAPYAYTWSNVPVGSYSLTAKATDALGITTTSAGITVTAIANVPPAVNLTGPANGTTVKAPGNFTLTATATSATSAIAKVDFYNGTTLLGTATAAPYAFTWNNVALGTYSITAKATDTLNATTTSIPVTVTVNTGIAQAYYIHTDQLDTPRVITDAAGNKVWEWQNSDPFGNNVPNENPNGAGQFNFNLRFPGQYFDKETGLHYNVNRDYDPTNGGRYIESDPIGLQGGINTYTYVNANPLSAVDLWGLFDVIFGKQGSSSNSTYNQAVSVVGNNGQLLGTFQGSSTPNPYKPSDPKITGTNAYPQVASGAYPVTIGTHQGEPALVLNSNGAVPTTTQNPNFPSQGFTARGVHIHWGYSSTWKGSAACPTIEPSQWQKFMNSIPANESGTVVIP